MLQISLSEFKNLNCNDIIIEKKDRYLSRLILVEYAGCESELTSISRYLYQSIYLKDKNKELSEILESIAQSEMMHFKILGKIIERLGEKPHINLRGINDRRIEKRKNISYKTIISENILKENESILKYKKLKNNIENESVSKLFDEIIKEEMIHKKVLEGYYCKNII